MKISFVGNELTHFFSVCSVISEDVAPRNDSIRLDPSSLASSAGTFYIAVGCACAMLLVVIVIASLAYVKSNKTSTQDSLQ